MNWADPRSAHRVPTPGQGFCSRKALLSDLRARLVARDGFAIATLNLDHAVLLRRNPCFAAAYSEHTHVTADGHPVVWFERLSGGHAELVTGSDLVVPLACLAAEAGAGVALVGSTNEALEGAAARLRDAAPHVSIPLLISPQQGFDPASAEADSVVARLRASDVGLCILALGAPKQEIFAARLRREIPSLGVASVGAGIDFLAGVQRRAPRILRVLALEWVWRLFRDPRRLGRRYANCAALLPTITAKALGLRLQGAGGKMKRAP